MAAEHSDEAFDDTIAEDVYTDTTIFSPEEIVRQLEESAVAASEKGKSIDARRQREIYMEQKRLRAELSEYDFEDDLLDS